MQYSRSYRRHHRERMIQKRRKQNARHGVGAVNEAQWRFLDARVRARTGCVCSCRQCGNPRRFLGNSARGKTRQELIAGLV